MYFHDSFLPVKACTNDDVCDHTRCYYCSSNNKCVKYYEYYCEYHECGLGDGHCDPGECKANHRCGIKNFLEFHPKLSSCAPRWHRSCIKAGKIHLKQVQIIFVFDF